MATSTPSRKRPSRWIPQAVWGVFVQICAVVIAVVAIVIAASDR